MRDTVAATRSEVVIVSTKIDDFSFRLKKLEDRDEKHLEREEKIELLITRMEAIIERGEQTMGELEGRVIKLERDVTTIKNNWRWVVGISGTVGSIIGGILTTLVNVFLKGG
jgi:hypothetical protein